MSPRFFLCAIYDRQICVVLKEEAPLAHALHNYSTLLLLHYFYVKHVRLQVVPHAIFF